MFRSSVLLTAAALSAGITKFTAMNEGALNPKEFQPYKVKDIKRISPNTNILEVELPDNQNMGSVTASYVLLKGGVDKNGKTGIKPYTPINLDAEAGVCRLLIKTYPNGTVSGYVDTLKVGDHVELKGPLQKYVYTANMKEHLSMIAGGTGIAPMYQIILEVLSNPEDKTKITLLYSNRSEEDILLKDELDALAAKHPEQFKIHYVLSAPNKSDPNIITGRINREMIETYLPGPSPSNYVLSSGPPQFVKDITGPKNKGQQGELQGALKELGFTEEMVFKY